MVIWFPVANLLLFSQINEKLRHGSRLSILLSIVGHSSHFDSNNRIQDKLTINSDASMKNEDMGHINQFC